MRVKTGENKNLLGNGAVVLNPITDEMMENEQPGAEGDADGGMDQTEQADLLKFVSETGANNSSDLPGVEQGEENEDGPDQDMLHDTILNDKPAIESDELKEDLGADAELIVAEPVPTVTETKPKTKTKAEPKGEPSAEKVKVKKEQRVDLGRDLMPEAYTAQEKKMFTLIENWEDVRNAVKTKRLVRAEVTQVNDDDKKITVRFGNIRGSIPYAIAGVDDLGKSLVWLVGRTICFVIESIDEKKDGGYFVANRSKGLEALAAEVRKVMKVGSIRQAVVSRVETWGVWVEMGGVYGRLAKRDILHSFVSEIADVLQPGNLIDVKITKISDTGRIQVSLKDALPDPWAKVSNNYKIGSIVSGKITGFIPDLIFIEVEPGVNTVAPFPRFPVNVGQRVAAKIRWIDVDKKRMSASIWKAV